MLYNQPTGGASNDPYIGKNVAAGIQGSKVPPGAIEFPQRELLAVITAAGLTPTNTDLTQVLQSIRKLIQLAFSNGTITQQAILNLIGGVGFSGAKKIQVYQPSSPSSQTIGQQFTAPCKGSVLGFSTASSTAQPGLANYITITVNGSIAAQTADSVGGSINDVATAQVKTNDVVLVESMIQNSQALQYNVSQQLNFIFLPS